MTWSTSSWDVEQNILKLIILGHFLPFNPPKNPKNQNSEKRKNLLEISWFYTCTKSHNHMIRSETDRIFLSFWAIFCLFTTWKSNFEKNEKNTCRYHYQNLDDMIYSSWEKEQNKLKLLILGHFLNFYPPTNLKNQNFEKWKNLLEIIFILHKCAKNHNHMTYGSWDRNIILLYIHVYHECR